METTYIHLYGLFPVSWRIIQAWVLSGGLFPDLLHFFLGWKGWSEPTDRIEKRCSPSIKMTHKAHPPRQSGPYLIHCHQLFCASFVRCRKGWMCNLVLFCRILVDITVPVEKSVFFHLQFNSFTPYKFMFWLSFGLVLASVWFCHWLLSKMKSSTCVHFLICMRIRLSSFSENDLLTEVHPESGQSDCLILGRNVQS